LFTDYGISARAASALIGEQVDYAVRPSRTPVALAAGLTDHYMRGAFYPEGGGQMLAARLVEAIRAYGGEVRMRARVRTVRVENGRTVGVELERSGEHIDAPVIISNADLKRTVVELVGTEHFSAETVRQVAAYRMSLPLFVVYLGVAEDYAARGAPNTNYFLWDSYDIEGIYEQLEAGKMADDAFVYVTVTSLKDPADARLAPHGHSNVQIMTVVPREYALWNVPRGPAEGGKYHQDLEYRRRKSRVTERLLAVAERVLPGISAKVVWQESATPDTQERFTLSTGGTSYGIEYAVDQMGPLRPAAETEIAGL
jgi:phytoene dehydrogenase-like protein